MNNAVYYVSYKLKKGADVEKFLQAAEKLNKEYISKQKGFISWQQLNEDNTWADLITFKTMDDLNNFKEVSRKPSETAKKFYAFMNPFSFKVHLYSVKKKY